ncbi:MAG: DMT family transporter [Gammaproteobacteria bacterium]|nr:DMT family transporter [Gammaproteobacteria bacterium]
MSPGIPLQAIVIAVVIHALWGGNPVAVKFSLLVFPPMWTAFLRFAIAIVCVAVWAWYRGIRFWPNRREWPLLFGLGILFTVQIAAMNIGFDLTSGAMSSVLISTNPLFAAFLAHFIIARDRMSTVKAMGLIVALLGVSLVLLRDARLAELQLINLGNWIVLLSAALLGLRLVLSAKMLEQTDEVRVVVWQMVISLPLFAAGGWLWETIHWENLAWGPVAGIAYQGFVVAGLGFMVLSYLMKKYTPSVMMSFNFVAPVAGVLLSVWLLAETVSALLIAGLVLVGMGLYLIARPAAPPARQDGH